MDKKLIKPNKFKETNKVKSYKSYNKTLRQKTMKGAIQILSRNVKYGFKPKYLIVGHFNDGNGNKRIQRRRLDIQYVERDLLEVKRKLLQILYGKPTDVAKAIKKVTKAPKIKTSPTMSRQIYYLMCLILIYL